MQCPKLSCSLKVTVNLRQVWVRGVWLRWVIIGRDLMANRKVLVKPLFVPSTVGVNLEGNSQSVQLFLTTSSNEVMEWFPPSSSSSSSSHSSYCMCALVWHGLGGDLTFWSAKGPGCSLLCSAGGMETMSKEQKSLSFTLTYKCLICTFLTLSFEFVEGIFVFLLYKKNLNHALA